MVAFGDDENRRYQTLVETDEHKRWYLFQRFKMALFGRERHLDKDIIIKDILGKEMRAIDIFSNAIRFIKAEVMGTLTDQTKMGELDIKSETDVHWVLIVPAIWDDLSKKFMRESATKRIPDDLLTIALEPEAASLYCKVKLGITELPIGHRYMVLDPGGGTADITVHEVNPDGTLSEIHQPTGGDFGGTNVDNGFIGMLVQLFGAPQFKKLQQDCMDDYLDFMQSFDSKKRVFDGSRNMIIRFPTHLKQIFASEVGDTVEALLDQTPFANQLEFKNDKLTVSVGLVKRWFDPSIINVVRCIQKLLEEVKPLTINNIFLVGGFSESPYVSSELQNRFRNMIRIPQDPSSAVLQGAVIYGHKPKAIGYANILTYLYHPASKRIRLWGRGLLR